MSELGAVKCDFCGFVAEMVRGAGQNLKAPEMWMKISYCIYISSGELTRRSDEHKKMFDDKCIEMRKNIKKQLPPMHSCPGCASEKVAVDLHRALPGKAKTVFGDERDIR